MVETTLPDGLETSGLGKSLDNTCNLGFRLWSFIVYPYVKRAILAKILLLTHLTAVLNEQTLQKILSLKIRFMIFEQLATPELRPYFRLPPEKLII